MPFGCPRAPESEELDIPVRQLIVGRYRILFIVERGQSRFFTLEGPMSLNFHQVKRPRTSLLLHQEGTLLP